MSIRVAFLWARAFRYIPVLFSIALILVVYFSFKASAQTLPQEPALWIAESRGVIRASQESGIAELEIPIKTGVRAVAVDSERGTVWSLSQRTLNAHDREGAPLFSVDVPGPQGEPVALEVTPESGVVWLAMQSQLWAFNASGQILLSRDLGKPFSAAALDTRNSRFWIAMGDTVEAVDETGGLVASQRLNKVKKVQAMAYAPESQHIWLAADDSLLQISNDGSTVTTLSNNKVLKDISAISSDGSGGLWAIDKRQLYAINSTGSVISNWRPFQDENPELVKDVQADPEDGSVWVASQRSVVHLAEDGSPLVEATPDTGDGKTRLIEKLFIEVLGKPRIEFVSPSNGALLNTRFPNLIITYRGADLDVDSIIFTANGVVIAFTCSTEADTAECMPNLPFADGVFDLAVTVANTSGEISAPAEVKITIDATPPVISILSPENGFLTNNTTLQIAGGISEPSSMAIDGDPVEIEDNQFSYGPVTLAEGSNTFVLVATDPAGNIGSLTLSGVLDSIPPQMPDDELIMVEVSGDQISITGRASSVEAGTQVTVINTRTGEQKTITANSEGGFIASIAGKLGDEIQIFSTDAATNQSESISIQAVGTGPFSGPIKLTIISPQNGSTVDGNFVLVVVDLDAPPNTGVSVNSVQAAAVPRSNGLRFYASVPVETGRNTLTVQAISQDGRTVMKSIEVRSNSSFPYRITPLPGKGIAPLYTQFRVEDINGYGISEIRADFNNDGTVDLVAPDEFTEIAATFSGVGLQKAIFTIFDGSGIGHAQPVHLLLLDPEQIDEEITAVWNGMNDALVLGNKDTALQFLSNSAVEKYSSVFEILIPGMPKIVSSYSPLQRSYVSDIYAEYGVNRIIDGVDRVFLIGFIINENGLWRVHTM